MIRLASAIQRLAGSLELAAMRAREPRNRKGVVGVADTPKATFGAFERMALGCKLRHIILTERDGWVLSSRPAPRVGEPPELKLCSCWYDSG